MSKTPVDFFNEGMAQVYDERNRKLSPIKDALHFSSRLILKTLPEDSKVLCVGAGTGSEILYFANIFPKWRFVALEPSKSMLDVCKKKMANAGLVNRCEFIHGYINDVPTQQDFNAILSLFVGHFVEKENRIDFFKHMTQRLNIGGYLIHTEISFDLDSSKFPQMLEKWEEVQKLMGATPETLSNLPHQLREALTVLPPSITEKQMQQAGLKETIQFFQALMICGWFAKK
ncbi:class I SAM-dependent methyltransferase [bacterium]|nr:class I SAM-dependent methyltransferase [bacterium]